MVVAENELRVGLVLHQRAQGAGTAESVAVIIDIAARNAEMQVALLVIRSAVGE